MIEPEPKQQFDLTMVTNKEAKTVLREHLNLLRDARRATDPQIVGFGEKIEQAAMKMERVVAADRIEALETALLNLQKLAPFDTTAVPSVREPDPVP